MLTGKLSPPGHSLLATVIGTRMNGPDFEEHTRNGVTLSFLIEFLWSRLFDAVLRVLRQRLSEHAIPTSSICWVPTSPKMTDSVAAMGGPNTRDFVRCLNGGISHDYSLFAIGVDFGVIRRFSECSRTVILLTEPDEDQNSTVPKPFPLSIIAQTTVSRNGLTGPCLLRRKTPTNDR